MNLWPPARLLVAATALIGAAAFAQSVPAHDGSHDFDFNLGQWHTSVERFADPFVHPDRSIRLEGTVTVRPVWNGRALLEEIEADGPKGHWEGLTLFLYNPQSGQWSQNYANAAQGRFDSAPTIGGMRDGNIELYSQDTLNGRSILVRGLWSDIRPDSHNYEESYSDDGGRSWKRAFFAHLTRSRP
jgi:hypothetical protein